MTSSIRTCLWFRDGRGREAAEFYCSLIPGSRVEKAFHGDAGHGAFSVIDFSLGGVPYQILDAGPMFMMSVSWMLLAALISWVGGMSTERPSWSG